MRKRLIRCTRCGKIIQFVHYVNGLPVCADDRNCYSMQQPKRLRKLDELKRRYAGRG